MQNETLGSKLLASFETFLLNNVFILIGLVFIFYGVLSFYYRFLYVNRDTDNVDLSKRYVKLEMFRRYRP